MSQIKRMMELSEMQGDLATQIAIDAGVLKSCPYHDTVYDPLNGDDTPAYKLGNYRLSAGELGHAFSSSREMTDAIKAAIGGAGMDCNACAKNRDD